MFPLRIFEVTILRKAAKTIFASACLDGSEWNNQKLKVIGITACPRGVPELRVVVWKVRHRCSEPRLWQAED